MKSYWVYILTNFHNTVLYTGMTNNLQRRMYEHKHKLADGFTKKYNVNKLIHLEEYPEASLALSREKQIKGWLRIKKIALINAQNPEWKELSIS